MFRRNADTIQGACYTGVERLLDLVELNFDATFERTHFALGFIDLGVGRFEFFGDGFFLLFFSTV